MLLPSLHRGYDVDGGRDDDVGCGGDDDDG